MVGVRHLSQRKENSSNLTELGCIPLCNAECRGQYAAHLHHEFSKVLHSQITITLNNYFNGHIWCPTKASGTPLDTCCLIFCDTAVESLLWFCFWIHHMHSVPQLPYICITLLNFKKRMCTSVLDISYLHVMRLCVATLGKSVPSFLFDHCSSRWLSPA